MTWTRLDDNWTERDAFHELPHAARWHYLCLVLFCSRNDRYDGVMRKVDARRASDVDDPDGSHFLLSSVGLIEITETTVRVVQIEEHVPPPYLRDEHRKEGQRARKRRSRLHKDGNHVECLPDECAHVTRDISRDVTRDVTNHVTGDVTAVSPSDGPARQAPFAPPAETRLVSADVTRDTGTGRDVTGRGSTTPGQNAKSDAQEVSSFWASGSPNPGLSGAESGADDVLVCSRCLRESSSSLMNNLCRSCHFSRSSSAA